MRRNSPAAPGRRDDSGGHPSFNLCHPDVEFHWPLSLVPLQPTQAQQRMDPRIVAATDRERRVGDPVNIETDIMMRYVSQALQARGLLPADDPGGRTEDRAGEYFRDRPS